MRERNKETFWTVWSSCSDYYCLVGVVYGEAVDVGPFASKLRLCLGTCGALGRRGDDGCQLAADPDAQGLGDATGVGSGLHGAFCLGGSDY